MKIWKATAFLGTLGLLLAGCTTIPEVPYDRMSAGEVKSIAIVTPSLPKGLSIILATAPGQSFGLLGAVIDQSLEESRERRFKVITDQRRFSTPETFILELKKDLEATGYTVTNKTVSRDVKPGFLKSYPKDMSADAYLDVVVYSYGYIAAGVGSSTPYRPQFALEVKLVRARDSATLMQDTVVYNVYNPGEKNLKAITISADPQYDFVDFEALQSNPDKAVGGLQDAAAKTASTISSLLK